MSDKSSFKQDIIASVSRYYQHICSSTEPFEPGKTRIPYAGRVFDHQEINNLVEASLDFWLTEGRFAQQLEKEIADFLDVKYCCLTNSGSSANLLAFMALTSSKLKKKQISRGDEVITVAAGFPTTITPIIQFGAVPVFADICPGTYNIDVSQLEVALSKKTKAVMLAHTIGNPFDVAAVRTFCDRHNLWLIEDNCDALGSQYKLAGRWQYTGTFGDVGTSSFYPPHHITMGEGGAVYTNNEQLIQIVKSFRDWGRDCYCKPGCDNTCGKRFSQQLGQLPFGYDHKYIYSHFGYNLKLTDMQAAIGCAQLKKLPDFIEARRNNWQYFADELADIDKFFILPTAIESGRPSWFGFVLTVKNSAPFSRDKIVSYLESRNIQTRMLFAGNIVRHPCFDEMRKTSKGYRVVGELRNTDFVMNNTFWFGVYPGLTAEMLKYVVDEIHSFIAKYV